MVSAILTTAWSDVRATRYSWFAVAVTLAAAGAATAYSLAFLIDGEQGAAEVGGTLLGFALIGTVCATTSITGLVVNERRRTYARWKLVGMSGAAAFTVVMVQVLTVTMIAVVPGTLLACPLVPWAAGYFAVQGAPLGDPDVGLDVIVIAVAICMGAVVLGSVGKVLAVSRVRPVAALRTAVAPTARPGILATAWSLMMAVALVMFLTSDEIHEEGAVLGVQVIVLLTVLPVTGWLSLALLHWTRLLHIFGPSARVAAGGSRIRSAFTNAQVLPWFLLAGLIVGIGSPMMVLVRADGAELTGAELLVPMLAPAVIPPLAAGIASILVLSPRMRTDVRVLIGAGAGRRHLLGVIGWESLVVVVSAGMLTLAVTVPGIAVANAVYRGEPWPPNWWTDILWVPFGVIAGAMWLLISAVSFLMRPTLHEKGGGASSRHRLSPLNSRAVLPHSG
ncbi:Putative membrane protein [Corynebacterium glyciniphilum AJ 3170]|uniref:Putative membrane protein n=1 Tax=Corynebacterium glyciniphilum AJ 3170 TaxID=1404245 RepID=X5DRF2_9CORY|nr:FtsX-like permease family protein [Corynebacterium glyciniphilum]AHW63854.1 Putative membrane protein [Corynebacterium glyciniphilum AJ 3170]